MNKYLYANKKDTIYGQRVRERGKDRKREEERERE